VRRERPALAERGEVLPVVRKRRAGRQVGLAQPMYGSIFRAHAAVRAAKTGLAFHNLRAPQRHHAVFEDARAALPRNQENESVVQPNASTQLPRDTWHGSAATEDWNSQN